MNIHLSELLERLRSGDEQTQQESLLRLWMVLERNFMTNRNDPLHRQILNDELFVLRLGEADMDEVVSVSDMIMLADPVPLRTKASLANILGKLGRIQSLRVVLRFLKDNFEGMDVESVNATVLAMSPAYFPEDRKEALIGLFQEFETETILRELLNRQTEWLNEPIQHVLEGIKLLRSGK